MPQKRAQIQIMETVAVLAVFFILVALGYIFYSKALKSGIDMENEENIQLAAIKIAQKASSLPELQCSQENIITDNCVNALNLKAFTEIISENEAHYFGKFSFSRITINEIYPDEKEWVVYDKSLEEYANKIATNIPILLQDSIENKNSFGVIKVEVFSK